MNIGHAKNIIIVLLITIIGFVMTKGTSVIEVPVVQQIDENTWVKRAEVVKRDSIFKDLEKNLRKEIAKRDGVIVNYVDIYGSLKQNYDSLSSKTMPIDTLVSSNHFFSDSTFKVKSDIFIKERTVKNDITFTQLKPLRIQIVSTLKNNKVDTYITSKQFEFVYVTKTELKPKQNKVPWLIGGILSGMIIMKVLQ